MKKQQPQEPLGNAYHVRHDQAVWEMTSFDVTVPAEIPKDEHKKWIEDNLDELMSDAIEAERAQISHDDQSVETCDTSITITSA